MSVEEELGWSIRDNHCSTLKQYIMSSFTPKGRLRRKDFLITLLAIFIVMYILAYIPAYIRSQECIAYREFLFPDVTLIYALWEEISTNAAETTAFTIICFISVCVISLFPILSLVLFCLYFKMPDTVPYSCVAAFAWFIWTLFFVYLIFCCVVRRLHDSGYSGWYLLLMCIPFVSLFLFYPLLTADAGYQNKYGSDPRKPYEGQYE